MKEDNSVETKIKQVFKDNPTLKEAYFVSNGNAFTNKDKAEAFSVNLKDQTVKHLKRKDVLGAKKQAPAASKLIDLSVKKLAKAIEEETDMAVLEALKAEETAKGKDARKGALDAIDARIIAIAEIKE